MKKNTMMRYIDYLNDIAGVYEEKFDPIPQEEIEKMKEYLKTLDKLIKDEDEDDEE